MHTATIFLDMESQETSRKVKQSSWLAKTDWDVHVDKNKAGKQESSNIIAYSFHSPQVGKLTPIWDFWLNGQK